MKSDSKTPPPVSAVRFRPEPPSQIAKVRDNRDTFRKFMRQITGHAGMYERAFHAYSWMVNGVLVTLWTHNGTVKVYHGKPNPRTPWWRDRSWRADTSGDRFGVAYFQCHQESCREHIMNLYLRHA